VLTLKEGQDLAYRPPMLVDMGPHVSGVAVPHPDCADRDTMVAGALKRFAARPPTADSALLQELEVFVGQWLKGNLTPLRPDSDTTVETWLETSNYPDWRKAQLKQKWANVNSIWSKKKYLRCKSFMKDEVYATMGWKHARGINSRSDEYKCAVGPIFHLIEKELFKHPAFIKYVPVSERPNYIMERIHREGAKYIATDYTSFEALFVRRLMEVVEFQLYTYMVQLLTEARDFDRHMDEVLAGENICTFKWFVIRVLATRMSGEMCTSLGNGFANLMLMLFAAKMAKCEIIPCVEGDDGIARCESGPTPTKKTFKKLGLRIKLVEHSELEAASFCGLIFDTVERRNVADPLKVLATFAWCTSRYANARNQVLTALLRCKSMCLAYQYPGCPILAELAAYGLRVTQRVRISKRMWEFALREHLKWNRDLQDAYHSGSFEMNERDPKKAPLKHKLEDLLSIEIGLRTRILMEKVFGVTINQQLMVESELREKDDLLPLSVRVLDFPESWYEYYEWYCIPARLGKMISYPGPLWTKRAGHTREW